MPDSLDGRRLQLLLEHCRESVALVDAEGRLIQEWAPFSERGLGYLPNELRGVCLLDLVHPEDLPYARNALAAALAAPRAPLDFACRVQSKNGHWRHLEGTLTDRTADPLLGGIVINWRDVTEQREAHRRASDAETVLARLFEEAPVGLVVATMDRAIRRVNPEFCRIVGFTQEELLGYNSHTLIWPEDYEKALQQLQPVREGRLPVLRMEARFVRKDRRPVWVDVAAFYMRDEQGQPQSVVGIVRDLTPWKQAQAEIEASRERIRQLATFVVQAREEERANVAREIHDELGQLLTGLMWEVESLARGHLPECPLRGDMEQRLQRVREHVRESLVWAKRMAVETRPGILEHLGLVEAIRWQAERFEKETGIQCVLELPAVEIELPVEQATTVFRVYQEALVNIARHSRASQVTVRLYLVHDRVVLTVKDNGKGLPPEREAGPLAVGLIGMKERAAQHGGRLRFFSKPGEGTAATLRLPKELPEHLDILANL